MNIKRFLLATTLVITMIFTLTGCGSFDASAYMQACLDANTHGEFEEYAKLTHTDIDTIASQYNALLNDEVARLDSFHATKEQKDKFRELFTNIYKSFRYEVGTATKNTDGSYSVPITTYKLTIFKDVISQGESSIEKYMAAQTTNGKTPSQEELYAVIIDVMYDAMKKNYEAKEYGEPVTVNVTVDALNGNSNLYGITKEELHSLLQNFIDLENVQ